MTLASKRLAVVRPRKVLRIAAVILLTACGDLFGPNTRAITMDVASERVPCHGVAPQECLRVREHPGTTWSLFYDGIDGFTFEPGFEYTLRVRVREIPNPPQDGSSLAYSLIAILRKVPA
jgi:Domain of unknown function (DUF4377)